MNVGQNGTAKKNGTFGKVGKNGTGKNNTNRKARENGARERIGKVSCLI